MKLPDEIMKDYRGILVSATLIVPEEFYEHYEMKFKAEKSITTSIVTPKQRGDKNFAFVLDNVYIENLKYLECVNVTLLHETEPIRMRISMDEKIFRGADVLFDYDRNDNWRTSIAVYDEMVINWTAIGSVGVEKTEMFMKGLALATKLIKSLEG